MILPLLQMIPFLTVGHNCFSLQKGNFIPMLIDQMNNKCITTVALKVSPQGQVSIDVLSPQVKSQ